MSKALQATLAAVVLFAGVANATIRTCINEGGCEVIETLADGTKVTHKVDSGDDFETTPNRSYRWVGGSDSWETN